MAYYVTFYTLDSDYRDFARFVDLTVPDQFFVCPNLWWYVDIFLYIRYPVVDSGKKDPFRHRQSEAQVISSTC